MEFAKRGLPSILTPVKEISPLSHGLSPMTGARMFSLLLCQSVN